METRIFIKSPTGIRIEALYTHVSDALGAVISHPHPLLGGDMLNPVVETVADALANAGVTTLRFNFRGTGQSTGCYGQGKGEQEDVLTAIGFLEEQGIGRVVLAGYSFGAWVNAAVVAGRPMPPALMVAPPLTLFPFDIRALRDKVGMIISGEWDTFCPSDKVKVIAAELASSLVLIPDTDHFLSAAEDALAKAAADYASTVKGHLFL